MRNKYPGYCYYCGKRVEKGEGHFERSRGHWRLIHADCCLKQREEKSRARKLAAKERGV